MNKQLHNKEIHAEISELFGSWPASELQMKQILVTKKLFTGLINHLENCISDENARYKAIVRTKLEEASFFAVKGICKPASQT